MPKAFLVSLGCDKNLVNSEQMMGLLAKEGVTFETNPSKAEIIIVNTCGFIEKAVEEAIDHILDLALLKEQGSCKKLVVTGCMVQRFGKKLPKLLPEVDLFLGTNHYGDITLSLKKYNGKILISPPRNLETFNASRIVSTPKSYAYLKIAEGCSNRCTYCMIPKLRGSFRSRSVDDVLKEALFLSNQHISEIILVAQDTTAYGMEKNSPDDLIKLLEGMEALPIKRIRLLYAYPGHITDSLLKTMNQSSKIVPYLDIPFQHVSAKILEKMGRTIKEKPEETIDRIRSFVSSIALRTTFIVGFPGEGEKEFEELLQFVERVEFDYLGAFPFSAEKGTSAARFPERISSRLRSKRLKDLYKIQKKITRGKLLKLKGKTSQILVEGTHPESELLLMGRLTSQAPDVDGTVIITSGYAPPGSIVTARITKIHTYDVEAEIIS